MFKLGADGVGYYLDVPAALSLDTLVPQEDFHLYRFSAQQWRDVAYIAAEFRTRRARRQRKQDGTRKKPKRTRRQAAMKNLPDDFSKISK